MQSQKYYFSLNSLRLLNNGLCKMDLKQINISYYFLQKSTKTYNANTNRFSKIVQRLYAAVQLISFKQKCQLL